MSFSLVSVLVWGHALKDGKPTTFSEGIIFHLPGAVNDQHLLRKGYSLESSPPTYTEALTDWIVCRPCTGNGCCVFLSVLALPHPASSISQTSHPPESSTSQTLPPHPPAPVFSLPSLLRCSLSLLVRELILSSLSAAGEHLSLQPEGGRSMGWSKLGDRMPTMLFWKPRNRLKTLKHAPFSPLFLFKNGLHTLLGLYISIMTS